MHLGGGLHEGGRIQIADRDTGVLERLESLLVDGGVVVLLPCGCLGAALE